MDYPKVHIEKITMDQNHYDDGNSRWNCLKLIEHSRKYPVFDLPLAGINIGGSPWGDDMSIDSFIYHSKRVFETSLSHPIILDDQGCIADGWHRVCKALVNGDTTIKAIRLETMPEPDYTYELKD